jgi:hypothetical protein
MEHNKVHEEVRATPAIDDYVFNQFKIGIVTDVDIENDIVWVEYVPLRLSKFLQVRKPVPGPTDTTLCWIHYDQIKRKRKMDKRK